MKYMDTLTEAIDALERDGFSAQFVIDDDGRISSGDSAWTVDDVTVEETVRFEGMSNPDDESIVLALRTADTTRGTLVLPYGPDLSGDQADTIRALVAQR